MKLTESIINLIVIAIASGIACWAFLMIGITLFKAYNRQMGPRSIRYALDRWAASLLRRESRRRGG